MPTYRMKTRGCSKGAVTGKHRSWVHDQEIEAPEGEFAHLSDGSYEIRPMAPKKRGRPRKKTTQAKPKTETDS